MVGNDTAKQELLAENANLRSVVEAMTTEIETLKNQLEFLKRQIFGARSERLVPVNDQQLSLPGFEPAEPVTEPEPTQTVAAHQRRAQRNQTGWQEFSDLLPREERVIDIPESERAGKTFIGYDVSERLAYRTGIYVIQYKIAKYANPENALDGIISATLPDESVTGGKTKFDLSFISWIIANKVENHLPLYRQSAMLEREKIHIDRSTLCRLFNGAAEAVTPVYERLVQLIMECEIVHADESPLKMLKPGNGKCHTGWIWCRKTGIGPPLTAFHFALNRSKDIAELLFGNYLGTIIRDAYAA